MAPPSRTASDVATREASPIAILGVPFDPVTSDQTVDIIAGWIASRRPHYAVTANVDFVVQAETDIELRRIIFDAHLVLCDGMPLVWASKLLGNPLPERVTGSDLMPRLLAEAEARNWRVFFLGGTPESVGRAAENTLTKHPGLRLVGAYSPPFKPLIEMDHADLVRRVTMVQPDLLFVAFGCPKQEKWINMHYRHLGVPTCIGIGATIDFIAGTFQRAPVWMQRTGTEWLFRLLQEPRRLAQRYGRGFWIFGRAILAQWRQLRIRRNLLPSQPQPQPAPPPAAAAAIPIGPTLLRPGIVAAPARMDAAEARGLTASWVAVLDQGSLIVDLRGTTFIDSTGVGLLVRLQKRARELDRRVLLARAQPAVLRALQLMKIDAFFQWVDELPSAPLPRARALEPEPISVPANATGLDLVWRGEITAVSLPAVAEEAESHLASLAPGTRVNIDLSAVTFADSSGIGLMVRLKKRAHQRDVLVLYAGPSSTVRNVLRLSRLEKYLLGEAP